MASTRPWTRVAYWASLKFRGSAWSPSKPAQGTPRSLVKRRCISPCSRTRACRSGCSGPARRPPCCPGRCLRANPRPARYTRSWGPCSRRGPSRPYYCTQSRKRGHTPRGDVDAMLLQRLEQIGQLGPAGNALEHDTVLLREGSGGGAVLDGLLQVLLYQGVVKGLWVTELHEAEVHRVSPPCLASWASHLPRGFLGS